MSDSILPEERKQQQQQQPIEQKFQAHKSKFTI